MKLGLPFFVLTVAAISGLYNAPHLLISWRCMAAFGKCVQYERCLYLGIGGYRNLRPDIDENCGAVDFARFQRNCCRSRACLRPTNPHPYGRRRIHRERSTIRRSTC